MPHVPILGSARVGASQERADSVESSAKFRQTKMDGLSAAAASIRHVLGRATTWLGEPGCIIVLDDFYHVKMSDQPYVLAYLHQVIKNLNIYLKVGAVQHRLVSFIEGDPPTGPQIGHDASEVSLDVPWSNSSRPSPSLSRSCPGSSPISVFRLTSSSPRAGEPALSWHLAAWHATM
jgi:hypothetical protein